MTDAEKTEIDAAPFATVDDVYPPDEMLPFSAPIEVRLNRIMRELKGIGKTSYNAQQQFNYRGIEQLTAALHDLFAKHGVIPIPQALESEWSMGETSNKKPIETVHVRVQWELRGLAGDSVTAITVGEGSDMSDKATNKASTGAFKYLLLQTFMVADPQDDADATTIERGAGAGASAGSTGRAAGTRSAPSAGRKLPTAGAPGSAAKPAPLPDAAPGLPTAASERPDGAPVKPETLREIGVALAAVGLDSQETVLRYVAAVIGRKVNGSKELTEMEGLTLLEALNNDVEKAGVDNG